MIPKSGLQVGIEVGIKAVIPTCNPEFEKVGISLQSLGLTRDYPAMIPTSNWYVARMPFKEGYP